jgi:hypothetical protein
VFYKLKVNGLKIPLSGPNNIIFDAALDGVNPGTFKIQYMDKLRRTNCGSGFSFHPLLCFHSNITWEALTSGMFLK